MDYAFLPSVSHLPHAASLLRPEECSWGAFMTAYEEESCLRRVFWIQKDNVPITAKDTYKSSHIGRKNMLFQAMFKKTVITIDDMDATLSSIDRSNCKMTEKLAALFDKWKYAMVRNESLSHPRHSSNTCFCTPSYSALDIISYTPVCRHHPSNLPVLWVFLLSVTAMIGNLTTY